MRVSFTGTRQGMSDWQKVQFAKFLADRGEEISVFAHGACVGADVEAHGMVCDTLGSKAYIAVFPSTTKTRVHVQGADFTADPKPPLERDEDIVRCGCDLLVATPLQMEGRGMHGGGTWRTIQYARKRHVPVLILWRK